jgi:hypothetical protein
MTQDRRAQIEAIQTVAPPPPPPRDEEPATEDNCAPPLPPPFPPSPAKDLAPPAPEQHQQLPRGRGLENQDEEPKGFSDLIKEKAATQLKGTNIPRSPGGTPLRRDDDHSRSPSKFLATALRNKFKTVRVPLSPVQNKGVQGVDEEEWNEVAN